jgi:hypothetical protein
MSMKRIRLELARDHEFPEGSRERGYEFAAPLDNDGHLLADDWCTTLSGQRFWHGEKDEFGQLVHRRAGSWTFDCKLDRHRFIPGKYVSMSTTA